MIVFSGVTKQFAPDSYGAKDVSFDVDPGELVVITGRSGAGKTTLLRLLTREYTADEGSIQFEDVDINEIRNSQLHHLRRRIGVVFQDYRLLPELNVWENIALPLSIARQSESEIEERVTDLLTLVELTDKAALFPRQLSGGEAQRISIARALANGPGVILADEPTGNLDSKTSERIAKLIQKINELGTTVLFATHDPVVLDLLSGKRHLHLDGGALTKDTKKKAKEEPKKVTKAKAKKKSKKS